VFTSREYHHGPLSAQAVPGRELGLRDAVGIETLFERLRMLVAMTADSGQRS
jgi:hypothetical protein